MQLYARLMIGSVVFALPFSPFVGMIVDRVNPRIVIPMAFSVRIFGIILFHSVSDPN